MRASCFDTDFIPQIKLTAPPLIHCFNIVKSPTNNIFFTLSGKFVILNFFSSRIKTSKKFGGLLDKIVTVSVHKSVEISGNHPCCRV